MSESELEAFNRGLTKVLPLADQSLVSNLSPQDLACDAGQNAAFEEYQISILAISETIYIVEKVAGSVISSCTIERNGADLFLLGCERIGKIIF